MKIVSYNINSCTQWKVDRLFEENADVYVVPEIAEGIKIPDDFEMKWIGKYPSKGLGMIWRKEQGIVPDWYNDKLSYAIPMIYNDVFILGFWPTKIGNETYTQIAKEILEYYLNYLKKYEQCIVTGDFNLFHKKDNTNKAADILKADELLKSCGLSSVYHTITAQAMGAESQFTYYHQRHSDNPFFLDYTYSKLPVKKYSLEPWDSKMSDHVCQVIEI